MNAATTTNTPISAPPVRTPFPDSRAWQASGTPSWGWIKWFQELVQAINSFMATNIAVMFKTNGVLNPDQTVQDLRAGSGIVLSVAGENITIAATSTGASVAFSTNGVLNPDQLAQDLVAGAGITLSVSGEHITIASTTPPGGFPTFVDNEVPSGSIDGVNVAFTLATAPDPQDCLEMYLNGLFQSFGVDYTLAGTAITFASAPQTGDAPIANYRYGSAGPAVLFVDDEVPAGTIDGVNDTFTLANGPIPQASLRLFLNGLLQTEGTDYLLAGNTITFGAPPQIGDALLSNYRL